MARRPAGEKGQRISEDYERPTLRMSPSTMARLRAWSALTGQPLWRLVEDSVNQAVERLPRGHQELIRAAVDAQAPSRQR